MKQTLLSSLFIAVSTSLYAQVGIGLTEPKAYLNVLEGKTVLFGADTAGVLGGTGRTSLKMIWYASNGAFRAGGITDRAKTYDSWDKANVGPYSFASGINTRASGEASTAMGNRTTASGEASTAMGSGTIASGNSSTAMGAGTTASGDFSTAMGSSTNAGGESSTAMGTNTNASGGFSTAMGYGSTTSGGYSTAMGYLTTAGADYSTAMGFNTNASAGYSTAMGNYTTASGNNSTAMGNYTTASGNNSTAMGNFTTATGGYSTAMGYLTTAGADYSTAMGNNTYASGESSTAMGYNTYASGGYSTAMGYNTSARADYSTAMGYNNTAAHRGSFIISDASDYYYGTKASDQMVTHFRGGYIFYTGDGQQDPYEGYSPSGVELLSNANAWSVVSDSTRKENFRATDGALFLKKISGMRLGSWNYKGQDMKQYRHYGPMAQDFFAAFGRDELGAIGVDKSINQADFDGVNLIAIQALIKEVEALKAENADLKQANASTKTETESLKVKMQQFEKQLSVFMASGTLSTSSK